MTGKCTKDARCFDLGFRMHIVFCLIAWMQLLALYECKSAPECFAARNETC